VLEIQSQRELNLPCGSGGSDFAKGAGGREGRRPRKAKAGTKGLTPAECRLDQAPAQAAEAAEAIEKAGAA
jgi:hypothetical protein